MARNFDGSTEYLSYGTPFLSDTPFTFAYWGRADNLNQWNVGLSQSVTANVSEYVILAHNGLAAGDEIGFSYRGTNVSLNTACITTSGYTADTWHHACGVAVSDSTANVYLDGGNKGTTSSGTFDSMAGSDFVSIGSVQRQDANDHYFGGDIADAAIWDAALTDAEVASLAAGYSPLLVRPQSLLAYWPLIGRTSPEIDIVGGYNMTLVNTPTTAAHPRIIYPGRQIYTPPTVAAAAGIPAHFMHYAKMRRG